MTRLGRKLGLGVSAAAPRPTEAPATPRELCLERLESAASVSLFHTVAGACWALPLSQLSAAVLQPEGLRMRILFSAAEVRLEGRNLAKLQDAIVRGQCFRLRPVSPSFRSEYGDEIFLSSVEVIPAKPLEALPESFADAP